MNISNLTRRFSWIPRPTLNFFNHHKQTPWQEHIPEQWKGREDEMHDVIESLSSNPFTFLLPLDESSKYVHDEVLKTHLLETDVSLQRMKSALVPVYITEEAFWKSYFYFVNRVLNTKQVDTIVTQILQLWDHAKKWNSIHLPKNLFNSTTADINSGRSITPLRSKRWSLDLPMQRSSSFNDLAPPKLIGAERDPPSFTNDEQRVQICGCLPIYLRSKAWKLLYSTNEHGTSIHSMLRRITDEDETVLLVRTTRGLIFGAVIGESWKMSNQFYGNGNTKLFTFAKCEDGQTIKVYKWTNKNEYFLRSDPTHGITFGSGTSSGGSGLHIEPDLTQGSSTACNTYGLKNGLHLSTMSGKATPESHFEIVAIEVWRFDVVRNILAADA